VSGKGGETTAVTPAAGRVMVVPSRLWIGGFRQSSDRMP
jgi:hypothetical protein